MACENISLPLLYIAKFCTLILCCWQMFEEGEVKNFGHCCVDSYDHQKVGGTEI